MVGQVRRQIELPFGAREVSAGHVAGRILPGGNRCGVPKDMTVGVGKDDPGPGERRGRPTAERADAGKRLADLAQVGNGPQGGSPALPVTSSSPSDSLNRTEWRFTRFASTRFASFHVPMSQRPRMPPYPALARYRPSWENAAQTTPWSSAWSCRTILTVAASMISTCGPAGTAMRVPSWLKTMLQPSGQQPLWLRPYWVMSRTGPRSAPLVVLHSAIESFQAVGPPSLSSSVAFDVKAAIHAPSALNVTQGTDP